MFYPQELDTYLSIHGFKILNKFGGFKEEIFENKSEKQIFVCKKMNSSEQKILIGLPHLTEIILFICNYSDCLFLYFSSTFRISFKMLLSNTRA